MFEESMSNSTKESLDDEMSIDEELDSFQFGYPIKRKKLNEQFDDLTLEDCTDIQL